MKDRFKGLHGDLFTPAADLVLTSRQVRHGGRRAGSGAALVALGYKPQEFQPHGDKNCRLMPAVKP